MISYNKNHYHYLINSDFKDIQDYIDRIPEIFEKEGKVIYTGRNLIKVMEPRKGMLINVKRYCVPHFINRIAYTFFRQSKGIRAFEYPQILKSKGFNTPEPIAYLEEKRCGLIRYSFFISVQSPLSRTMYEFGNANPEDCKDFICAFARYTAQMHEAGILHKDYSPGNILFDKIDGKYQFSLVDINRMQFKEIDLRTGCANFARLWGQIGFFKILAAEYAQARKADVQLCTDLIMEARRNFWTKYAQRHEVKYKLEL